MVTPRFRARLTARQAAIARRDECDADAMDERVLAIRWTRQRACVAALADISAGRSQKLSSEKIVPVAQRKRLAAIQDTSNTRPASQI
jgi:hypothetical protein